MPLRSLALNGKEQSVVVGCAAVVDLSDVCVLVFDGWVGTIQQIQPAALICVRRCGARIVGHSIDRARTKSEKHRKIDLLNGPQVNRVASDIARRHKPILTDLSLQAQIPLVDLNVRRVRIDINNVVEVRPWRALVNVRPGGSRGMDRHPESSPTDCRSSRC